MTFPDFLRSQVERIGAGNITRGEEIVAEAFGVTSRTIRLWGAGGGKPTKVVIAGARVLLPAIKPVWVSRSARGAGEQR